MAYPTGGLSSLDAGGASAGVPTINTEARGYPNLLSSTLDSAQSKAAADSAGPIACVVVLVSGGTLDVQTAGGRVIRGVSNQTGVRVRNGQGVTVTQVEGRYVATSVGAVEFG